MNAALLPIFGACPSAGAATTSAPAKAEARASQVRVCMEFSQKSRPWNSQKDKARRGGLTKFNSGRRNAQGTKWTAEAQIKIGKCSSRSAERRANWREACVLSCCAKLGVASEKSDGAMPVRQIWRRSESSSHNASRA